MQVLVIDDEPAVSYFLSAFMRTTGRVCYEAATESQALEVAAHNPEIELVIADVGALESSGEEFSCRLAGLGLNARVLFTSGHVRDQLEGSGALPREAAFLGKPYLLSQLEAAIQEVLGPAAVLHRATTQAG
jgi:CheY-like chemotaxis protein